VTGGDCCFLIFVLLMLLLSVSCLITSFATFVAFVEQRWQAERNKILNDWPTMAQLGRKSI
jgi:hypothetical protein